MAHLSLKNISKRFDETAAVTHLSIEIERGEFFGLLGPSGCGKTTALRMIAGLETPDTGSIELEGRDIINLSAERRGFGMVFQNYALFPHLNVFENVAFGLRARHKTHPEVKERVADALELVQLQGYDKRKVDELSGGQQQRVAIARAIAIEPALLLFDEPLSNLDITLREETRSELRQLVTRLGLTAVYVTHDQDEAFALCDRIAVMKAGSILQIGAARELYEHPAGVGVARFLGRNNLIPAMRITSSNTASARFRTLAGEHLLTVQSGHEDLVRLPMNKPCTLTIRPEAVNISKSDAAAASKDGENTLRAQVQQVEFGGATTRLRLDANGLLVEALLINADNFSVGDECTVTLPPNRIILLQD
ncbi:MAG: iron(III) transport system ATP-binding protein [Blastocatellia bacterium]|jgi:iron(III) transport system ATP-binding protein|nr:iron(III) transport system ATP-binding protein [Blastocatellia bacterium]